MCTSWFDCIVHELLLLLLLAIAPVVLNCGVCLCVCIYEVFLTWSSRHVENTKMEKKSSPKDILLWTRDSCRFFSLSQSLTLHSNFVKNDRECFFLSFFFLNGYNTPSYAGCFVYSAPSHLCPFASKMCTCVYISIGIVLSIIDLFVYTQCINARILCIVLLLLFFFSRV